MAKNATTCKAVVHLRFEYRQWVAYDDRRRKWVPDRRRGASKRTFREVSESDRRMSSGVAVEGSERALFLCTNFIRPCDLDLRPFDIGGVRWIELTSKEQTNFEHPTIIHCWVMGDSIWSHYHRLKRSLRMRRVTWPITGRQNDTHFQHPCSQFIHSLCHFQGATTKIEPYNRQKIGFFTLRTLQSSLRMRSIMHVTCA